MSTNVIVELMQGRVRWFYHIRARNGNIMATSQKYFSKSNAMRAAKVVAKNLKADLIETL